MSIKKLAGLILGLTLIGSSVSVAEKEPIIIEDEGSFADATWVHFLI